MVWYELLRALVSCCADIATVVGVIGVVMAVATYRKTVRYRSQDDETRLMENSVKVMGMFNDVFVPQMNAYQHRFEGEYKKRLQAALARGRRQAPDFSLSSINESFKREIRQQTQLDANVVSLFEQLERICTYIANDMTANDIVYPDLHQIFLGFIDSNWDSLDVLTTEDRPFTSLHHTYNQWNKCLETDRIMEETDTHPHERR